MSYADFVIFKEHKFLRNIFSELELSSTDSLKSMEQYHKCFEKFLIVSVYLQNSINTINEFSEYYNDELIDFCNEFCADCSDFAEIKEPVLYVLVKNKQGSKFQNSRFCFMHLFIKDLWTFYKYDLTMKH